MGGGACRPTQRHLSRNRFAQEVKLVTPHKWLVSKRPLHAPAGVSRKPQWITSHWGPDACGISVFLRRCLKHHVLREVAVLGLPIRRGGWPPRPRAKRLTNHMGVSQAT